MYRRRLSAPRAIQFQCSSIPARQATGPTLAPAVTAGCLAVHTPDDGQAVAAPHSPIRLHDLQLEYQPEERDLGQLRRTGSVSSESPSAATVLGWATWP